MAWAAPPAPTGAETVSMTAAVATDRSGVQYYFACTAGGGHDSGWQSDPTYEDSGLAAGAAYTYAVRARDLSVAENETDVDHGTPAPDVPITVTGRVEDATTVSFTYVIDFGAPVEVPMADDGVSGDGEAGDGVYGASVPAQPVGTMIRYRIDAFGPTGAMGYPRDDDTVVYRGTYLVDPGLVSDLPVLHWIMHPDDYAAAVEHWRTDEVEPAMLFYDGVLYDGLWVRVRGQSSRSWPKKHWKFKFPKGNGFFAEGITVVPVDEIVLQSNYSDKSYLRETLSYETFRDVGAPSHIVLPVALHQNGAFFGLYTYVEEKDSQYLERNGLDTNGALYKGYSQCEYLPFEQLPARFEKKNPDDGDFSDLYDLLTGVNQLTGQERRDFLFDHIDIPGMISYLVGTCLVHNNDHVAKNYFLYRDTFGTERWSMHAWDMDLTFGRSYQGRVLNDDIFADDDDVGRTDVSPSHPLFGDSEHQKWDFLWNRIIDAVLKDPDILPMYYRRLRTAMDELLVEGHYEARIDELVPLIEDEAEWDRSLWGWYGVAETLAEAVDRLKLEHFAVRRTHLFVTHRVDGEIPEAQSLLPQVVITEIMYNPYEDPDDPTDDGPAKDFLELYNPSATEAVDLSGWRLEGVDLTIPAGSVILPQRYLLVVSDDPYFRATYGSGHFVAAMYGGKLSGAGERLVLLDRDGAIVDEVTYDDELPWPTEPDGEGPSLELLDPTWDNSLAGAWAPSATPGGTPGAPNSVSPASP